MSELFHVAIFVFHFAAALMITFGIWFRCDPDAWVSRMYVDTYAVQANSSGLWWDQRSDADVQACSLPGASNNQRCFQLDLPLYEKSPGYLGWQLFALLGNFEWISAAFAYFYVKSAWYKSNWWVSSLVAAVGTLLFMPFRGQVFVNQVVLQLVNLVVCLFVFRAYKDVYNEPAPRPQAPSSILARAQLGGDGDLVTAQLRYAHLPAMRFCEYCITASELWVAVLSVYVQDAPAFMSLGGYTLILLTNLYGVLLHYSLISDNAQGQLAAAPLPSQLAMPAMRRTMRVPDSMLPGKRPLQVSAADVHVFMQRRVWGSYIASNASTLLNSWLAYLVAMGVIFYQQTFLTSPEPPLFVVFAGWSLIVSYSSFGLWMTLVYWYPDYAVKVCCCLKTKETYEVALYGLDVLSLAAKLSIVGALSYGFVFRAEGRC